MTSSTRTAGTIPIFDSLTHPSLDGSWLYSRISLEDNSFHANTEALIQANVRWAWAVSMAESGAYAPTEFIRACEETDLTFLPAAYISPSAFANKSQVEEWLRLRKAMGFRGVKLHPRLGQFDFHDPRVVDIILSANDLGMIPFVCTYFYSASMRDASLSLESISILLRHIPYSKVVLLHGGTTRLLEMAELTRHFKSALLDVSWTMCEFAGSSLDFDLRHVLEKCQDRVCIGSDSPEYAPHLMRSRFELLTNGMTEAAREKIAYRNLLSYSGLQATA
jgi:predicted TIM-barrel fold metal-dependent hydrolase